MAGGAQTFHPSVLQPFYKGRRAEEQCSSWSLATLTDSAAAGCLQHPEHPGAHAGDPPRPSPHSHCPAAEATSLSLDAFLTRTPGMCLTVSCRALHGHRDGQSRAGALAPRDPPEMAQGQGSTLYPVPAAAGKGSEEEWREGRRKGGGGPCRLPLSSALQSCFTGRSPGAAPSKAHVQKAHFLVKKQDTWQP